MCFKRPAGGNWRLWKGNTMPTRTVQLLALFLLLTAAVGTAPALVAAQDQTDYSGLDGRGIRFERLEGGDTYGGDNKTLEEYVFFFDRTAYLPEFPYPEVMVVQVESGSFALRVGNEDLVIADPGGRDIHILESTGDPIMVSDPGQAGDVVRNRDGTPCTDLCALPPETMVVIETGGTVFLPGGVTCFWCNVSFHEAQLLVFPSVPDGQQFSWTQLGQMGEAGTPEVAGTPASAVRHFRGATFSGAGVGCR